MTAHQFRPDRALLRGLSVMTKPGSLRLLLWDVVAMIGLTMLGALAVQRGYEGAGTSLVHNPWSLTLAGLGIAWWLMSDSAWLKQHMARTLPSGAPWRLGQDELRLLWAWVAAMLGIMAMQFVLVIAILPLMVMHMGAMESQSDLFQALTGITLTGVSIGAGALASTLAFRFFLAGPISISERRPVMFEGWTLSAPFWGRLLLAAAFIGALQATLNLLASKEQALGASFQMVLNAQGLSPLWAIPAIYVLGHLTRGVVCEATLAAQASQRDADTTPPASPDAPCPAPEAV